MSKIKFAFFTCIILSTTVACSTLTSPASTPVPAPIIISTPTALGQVPLSEAEVPRISLENARAAIESGAAIVIDVRSKEAYAASHVPGALNIQLGEFEINPTGLSLDKEQWIVTYCT